MGYNINTSGIYAVAGTEVFTVGATPKHPDGNTIKVGRHDPDDAIAAFFTVEAGAVHVSLNYPRPEHYNAKAGVLESAYVASPTPVDGVASIAVSAGGTGYTTADTTVTIGAPAAGGTQATATPTITGGAVASIAITNAGSGYDAANPPTVTITDTRETPVGANAVAAATVGPTATQLGINDAQDQLTLVTYSSETDADDLEAAIVAMEATADTFIENTRALGLVLLDSGSPDTTTQYKAYYRLSRDGGIGSIGVKRWGRGLQYTFYGDVRGAFAPAANASIRLVAYTTTEVEVLAPAFDGHILNSANALSRDILVEGRDALLRTGFVRNGSSDATIAVTYFKRG